MVNHIKTLEVCPVTLSQPFPKAPVLFFNRVNILLGNYQSLALIKHLNPRTQSLLQPSRHGEDLQRSNDKWNLIQLCFMVSSVETPNPSWDSWVQCQKHIFKNTQNLYTGLLIHEEGVKQEREYPCHSSSLSKQQIKSTIMSLRQKSLRLVFSSKNWKLQKQCFPPHSQ